jgi:integrase/recombinase XerD
MGNTLKQKILVYNGIVPPPEIENKHSVSSCPRCNLLNVLENKYCSGCSYPLVPSAFDEIKLSEEMKFHALEEKYQYEMKIVHEEMNMKLEQILDVIQKNPQLALVKPEVLRNIRIEHISNS